MKYGFYFGLVMGVAAFLYEWAIYGKVVLGVCIAIVLVGMFTVVGFSAENNSPI